MILEIIRFICVALVLGMLGQTRRKSVLNDDVILCVLQRGRFIDFHWPKIVKDNVAVRNNGVALS